MSIERLNIRLPPRPRLRDADSETGSYPTISRDGDIDRTGRFSSIFDDRQTIIFATGVQVLLPSLLQRVDFINGNALLSTTSSLEATGTVRKGIADANVGNRFGAEDLSAFNEARNIEQHYGAFIDPFFTTGSSISDVGFGFQSPLRSKTKFTIDLTPSAISPLMQYTSVVTETGTSTPMSYFNFGQKTWEGVGVSNQGLYSAEYGTAFNATMLGFSPTQLLGVFGATQVDVLNSGWPTTAFGFPSHPKYHATSSQLFKLSGSLSHPFVLEKIVYEFSASYVSTGSTAAITSSLTMGEAFFFIMNQRRPARFTLNPGFLIANYSASLTASVSVPTSRVLSMGGPNVYVDTFRDLVTWASFRLVSGASVTNSNGLRDTNVFLGIAQNFSGSMVLSASVRSPTARATSQFIGTSNTDPEITTPWEFGRSGVFMSTGRDLVGNVTGAETSGTLGYSTITASYGRHQFDVNPYVLLPTDSLVFGWQVSLPDASASRGHSMQLNPGLGRLTLYGSLIKGNQEFHETINQPLTSDAVHEDIHFDVPVFDQFDVEISSQFSGSSIGEFVTGTLSTGSISRVVAATTIGGSLLAVSSSEFFDDETRKFRIRGLSRGLRLATSNERFFDTVLPRADKIAIINGSIISGSSLLGNIAILAVGHPTPELSNIDVTWNRAFPFEPKYSSVERTLDAVKQAVVTAGNLTGRGLPIALVRSTVNGPNGYVSLKETQLGSVIDAANPETFAKDYFGVGNFLTGSPDPASFQSDYAYGSPKPRGFKYGILNAIPQFSSAVWRWNRFGQLRDMLEQRLDSKMFDSVGLNSDGTISGRIGATAAVVLVTFVSSGSRLITSPMNTSSSNVSTEVTSSVPYFDGLSRNR